MKNSVIAFLFTLIMLQMYGQKMDTLTPSKKVSYKAFLLPTVLISGGTLLLNSRLNTDLQENFNTFFGENFHTYADNILLFAPIAQIYAGKYFGFKSKNDFSQQTKNIAIANTATLIIVDILKHSIKEKRPDLSDNLSFPSGHTAIVFTNAALLYQEYKDSNSWYASSGFVFATATGILRIANNKHYTSDVLTGAGIGLASGILVSHWNPFQSLKLGKNKKTSAILYPQLGNQTGLGLLATF